MRLDSTIDKLAELNKKLERAEYDRYIRDELLKAVIAQAPWGVVVADRSGKILTFNVRAQFILGHELNNINNLECFKVFPFRDLLQGKNIKPQKVVVGSGEYQREVTIIAKFILIEDDAPIGAVALFMETLLDD